MKRIVTEVLIEIEEKLVLTSPNAKHAETRETGRVFRSSEELSDEAQPTDLKEIVHRLLSGNTTSVPAGREE